MWCVELAIILVGSLARLVYAETTGQAPGLTPLTAEIRVYEATQNKGDLLELPFMRRPLGAVKATGWLENQLLLQANGLTGNMKEFNNYNAETSAWLGSSGDNWEKGPYFMRGLVALAYALDDEELIAEAQQWVDALLNSQREDGYFGPANNNDWWARMPALMAIRDYYEATKARGNEDDRVLPFFEKYFRYQAEKLPGQPLSSWAVARGGDNIDSVPW